MVQLNSNVTVKVFSESNLWAIFDFFKVTYKLSHSLQIRYNYGKEQTRDEIKF